LTVVVSALKHDCRDLWEIERKSKEWKMGTTYRDASKVTYAISRFTRITCCEAENDIGLGVLYVVFIAGRIAVIRWHVVYISVGQLE
jgi:hypothetical protein